MIEPSNKEAVVLQAGHKIYVQYGNDLKGLILISAFGDQGALHWSRRQDKLLLHSENINTRRLCARIFIHAVAAAVNLKPVRVHCHRNTELWELQEEEQNNANK